MMKKFFSLLEYFFFRIIIEIFRFIPFFILYRISDFFALLLIVFSYRKKIIYDNLKKSFPEKSNKEIRKIALKYYFHLADIILESAKGFTMSKKQFLKRYKLSNPEIDIKYFDEGKNVIYVGGHYGNWEWGTQATPFILKHKVIILYKPLKNPFIDKYIKKRRERFGVKMLSIRLTGRGFGNYDKPYCVIMVSDQNPSNKEKAIWVDFLNRQTAVLHGVELYAKLQKMPVIFFGTKKIKRGFYVLKLYPITDNPRDLPKGEITAKFMKLLEKSIRENPPYWLWSHRRWKYEKD